MTRIIIMFINSPWFYRNSLRQEQTRRRCIIGSHTIIAMSVVSGRLNNWIKIISRAIVWCGVMPSRRQAVRFGAPADRVSSVFWGGLHLTRDYFSKYFLPLFYNAPTAFKLRPTARAWEFNANTRHLMCPF